MKEFLRRHRALVLVGLTGSVWLMGKLMVHYEVATPYSYLLQFFGVLLSLIVVGYFSAPSNPTYRTPVLGFVMVVVLGLLFKVLHLLGANEILIFGVAGIVCTYLLMIFNDWRSSRRKKS